MDINIFLQEADIKIERGNMIEIKGFIEIDIEEKIKENQNNKSNLCLIYYTRGNLLSKLKELVIYDKKDIDNIEQIQENVIYSLRVAAKLANECNIEPIDYLASILTNLANELDSVGRFIEAIEIYESIEKLIGQSFPMAIGNKGWAYMNYASHLYDKGQSNYLRKQAHLCFSYAIEYDEYTHSNAHEFFLRQKLDLEKYYTTEFLEYIVKNNQPNYSDNELEYRKWCLDNKLFLNPLNDINDNWIADRDIFGLPSITVPLTENYPTYHSYFNQIKQEYVSARWFLYESSKMAQHYSDNQVMIYNTLDYQSFGLSTQFIKTAFRTAYSIFDKIGYFLYKYYNIQDIRESQVSFKTIWYQNPRSATPTTREFLNLQSNLPLKALFWLSKDMHYKGDLEYRIVMEPESKDLDILRNHLEHKFISVYDDIFGKSEEIEENEIYRDDLYGKTLKIIKLARASIIYLSLSIHSEEEKRNLDIKGITVPIDI